MTFRSSFSLAAIFAVASSSSGCGDQAVQFDTKYASDFAQASRATVSVLGIFQDGRLSPEAWKQMGPMMSSSLGETACEAGYSDELLAKNPDLSAAINDVAQADGVTDELIDQLTPAAKGDTVLVVTMSGQVPKPTPAGGSTPSAQASAGGAGMRGSRRGGGGGRGGGRPSASPGRPGADTNVLEMSASLYSSAAHHAIALVELHYTGPSADDALQKFVAQLKTVVRGSRCVGWNWSAPVEEERIRKLLVP